MQIIRYVLSWRSYSFVHYTISLSSLCKLIWRHWTSQIYFVECESKIRHILSDIHYTIRGAVCFQFTHFPCDWENIYTLSYYHHQIGSTNYYPLFRVRSWNNGVRCMSFCILICWHIVIAYFNHKIYMCRVRARANVFHITMVCVILEICLL